MQRSFNNRLNNLCSNIFAWIALIIFAGSPFIIWGSITASYYVKDRHTRDTYTNTTCLLLNYTLHKHLCISCYYYGCRYYNCFDEYFTLSYPTLNNTIIETTVVAWSNAQQHAQREV